MHATHSAALFVMCQIKLLLLFSCLNGNARVALREKERERIGKRKRGREREKEKTPATPKRNSHGQPSVKIPN